MIYLLLILHLNRWHRHKVLVDSTTHVLQFYHHFFNSLKKDGVNINLTYIYLNNF